MDKWLLTGIAAAVVIVIIIAGYFLLAPGGGTTGHGGRTITGSATGSTTKTSGTRTGTSSGATGTTSTGQTTNGSTTATTTQSPILTVSATVKSRQPTQQEEEQGTVWVISVHVSISSSKRVGIKQVYFDNIKPGSTSPLQEYLYWEYDPPKNTPFTLDETEYLSNDVPSAVINQWKPGTTHILNIVYVYNGHAYRQTYNVTIQQG